MRREQIDHPIEVLDLPVRAYNGLKRAGIERVSQVLAMSDEELLAVPGIGISTLGGIMYKLDVYRRNPPPPIVERETPSASLPTQPSGRTLPALAEWERRLRPQVAQVELEGEVPITGDECAQLGKAIGLRVKGLGHGRAIRTLEENYPCALATYLVAVASAGGQ